MNVSMAVGLWNRQQDDMRQYCIPTDPELLLSTALIARGCQVENIGVSAFYPQQARNPFGQAIAPVLFRAISSGHRLTQSLPPCIAGLPWPVPS